MSFDDIPENLHNSQPCPNCENGDAVEDKKGNWSCDTCDWCYVKNDGNYILDWTKRRIISRKLAFHPFILLFVFIIPPVAF